MNVTGGWFGAEDDKHKSIHFMLTDSGRVHLSIRAKGIEPGPDSFIWLKPEDIEQLAKIIALGQVKP